MFAGEIRKRRVRHRSFSRWRWHLDEVFVRINGETHYLWRAVDHEGEVFEVFATKRRDRKAALKFIRRTMKRYGRPHSIVTDRLRSYRWAMKVIGNAADQEFGRWLNNRAENSHQPFRRRERAMAKFRDVKNLAEVRRRPCPDPQPFQSGSSPQSPQYLQTEPRFRIGRMAPIGSLMSPAYRHSLSWFNLV